MFGNWGCVHSGALPSSEMEELTAATGRGLLMSSLILFNFGIVVTPNTSAYFSLLAHSLYIPKGQRPKNYPRLCTAPLGINLLTIGMLSTQRRHRERPSWTNFLTDPRLLALLSHASPCEEPAGGTSLPESRGWGNPAAFGGAPAAGMGPPAGQPRLPGPPAPRLRGSAREEKQSKAKQKTHPPGAGLGPGGSAPRSRCRHLRPPFRGCRGKGWDGDGGVPQPVPDPQETGTRRRGSTTPSPEPPAASCRSRRPEDARPCPGSPLKPQSPRAPAALGAAGGAALGGSGPAIRLPPRPPPLPPPGLGAAARGGVCSSLGGAGGRPGGRGFAAATCEPPRLVGCSTETSPPFSGIPSGGFGVTRRVWRG